MVGNVKEEKLTVTINPETGVYKLNIDYVHISNIRDVCSDIVRRIDGGEFHNPDLVVDEEEEDRAEKDDDILSHIN